MKKPQSTRAFVFDSLDMSSSSVRLIGNQHVVTESNSPDAFARLSRNTARGNAKPRKAADSAARPSVTKTFAQLNAALRKALDGLTVPGSVAPTANKANPTTSATVKAGAANTVKNGAGSAPAREVMQRDPNPAFGGFKGGYATRAPHGKGASQTREFELRGALAARDAAVAELEALNEKRARGGEGLSDAMLSFMKETGSGGSLAESQGARAKVSEDTDERIEELKKIIERATRIIAEMGREAGASKADIAKLSGTEEAEDDSASASVESETPRSNALDSYLSGKDQFKGARKSNAKSTSAFDAYMAG
ncbi:hypothetical protein [Burkholderia sp. Cy-637]|uniref:hypothetical protein n=1 Tax=Burkholderia sp. Cy-637 TaxID=2608327 RepID=UPI001421C426|nr:hypothetical protein [Burkholderia sp. Cy-637]NIF88879.1 hypothetical protein [Burkholderia sp. Cy-637]